MQKAFGTVGVVTNYYGSVHTYYVRCKTCQHEVAIDRRPSEAFSAFLNCPSCGKLHPYVYPEVRERLEPSNQHERDIKTAVDAKAKAIHDGVNRWDDSIITAMRIAVGFEMSVEDAEYFIAYVRWLRENQPLG